MSAGPGAPGFVPGLFAIDAYGRGGFRFAEMSHRGSILVLPVGVHAWAVQTPEEIDLASLEPLIAAREEVDLVLFGMGADPTPLAAGLRRALAERGLGRVETMTTSAAARTYNVLMSERRRVAAGLIAVP